MALAAAEASLYTNKTEVPVLADNLSLEHLVPQEWEKHWPLTDTDGSALEGEALERAAAERWARLNRLGNLTIVTQPLTPAMSNSPWEKKRAELKPAQQALAEREARRAEHLGMSRPSMNAERGLRSGLQ